MSYLRANDVRRVAQFEANRLGLTIEELIEVQRFKQSLDEASPKGKEAEEWISSAKPNFQKQYGKNWEKVLYSTAWKKFGTSK